MNLFRAHIPYFSYAGVTLAPTMLAAALSTVAGIYTEHFGLSLGLVTLIVLVAGLFDTITDPLVGFLSDLEFKKTGSRRFFVYSGIILMIPGSWFLYTPVFNEAGVVSLQFFIASYLCVYWGFTCYYIPHLAWPSNLTSERKERLRYFGYRFAGIAFGGAVFFVIPFFPVFESTKITPELLRVTVVVAGAVAIPSLVLFARFGPGETESDQFITPKKAANPILYFKSISANKPFTIFIVSHLTLGLGTGGFYGLMFVYINSYLGAGEYFPHLMLFYMLVGILINPAVVSLCSKLDDRRAMLFGVIFKVGMFLLYVIPAVLNLPLFLTVASLVLGNFLGSISAVILAVTFNSMLSSIADYDRLMTKTSRSGMFFSADSFLNKLGRMSLGPVLGLGIVALFGFEPSDPKFGDRETLGFILALALVPVPLTILSYFFFRLIPLCPDKQKTIRRRLKRNDQKAALVAVKPPQRHLPRF